MLLTTVLLIFHQSSLEGMKIPSLGPCVVFYGFETKYISL